MRGLALLVALACPAAAQMQPVAVTILPSNGATNVPLNARVIAALSFPATYNTQGAIKLTKAGAVVSGSNLLPDLQGILPPQGAFGWFAFIPDRPLDPNTRYNVEVDAPNRPPSLSTFTTGTAADSAPLQLISSDPAQGQDGVNTVGHATLRFNKPVDPFSFKQASFAVRDLGTGYSAISSGLQVQPDGATLTFNLGLSLGHAFRIEYSGSGVTDWLGNALSPAPAPIPFTTFRTTEKDGPLLAGSVPADGAGDVPTNSNIVLVFDKPLAKLPFDSGVNLDAGGALKFKVDNSLSGGRVLIIQPALLFPPNTQVSIRVTGLIDSLGEPLAAPITLGFRTGAAPETRTLQVGTLPSSPLPQNAAIQVTFNRAIDPLLLSLGGVSLYPLDNYVNHTSPAYQLSDDHRTISISPGTPLPAGNYRALISLPFDQTLGKLQPFQVSFTVSGDVDTTPPQLVAVTPQDGTTNAPLTALLQVAFSKPVVVSSSSSPAFQLLKDGSSVAGTFTVSGIQGSFVPKAPLEPSANYQIVVSGIADLEGNPLAPFSSSFSTAAASPAADRFQVVAIDPPLNATGVDPTASVMLTFNRAVNPVSALQPNVQYFLRSAAAAYPVTGTFQVNGPTVTYTPATPLPPGRYFVNPAGITDLAGMPILQFSSVFQTNSAAADTTPLTVVSVSPGDGQTVLYQNPYVVFTFSKPLDPGTITAANFIVYGTKGPQPATPSLLLGNTRVSLKFNAEAGTLVTLYLNPGVTDLSGNAVAPFRTTVRVVDLPSQGTGVSVRPGYRLSSADQNNLPPNVGISVLFSAPVDRASVEQGLLVTANGALVSGTIVWTPDSMGLTFLASTPYPYSATVAIAIVSPAHDAAGNPISYDPGYYGTLGIANPPAAPPASLAVTGTNLPLPFGPSPLDSVIELAFSQDVPASFVNPKAATLTDDTTGPTRGQIIPCVATLIRPRVVRFQPQSLMRPNDTYTFTFDAGTGLKYSNFIWTGSSVTAPGPHIVGFGPNNQSAPLNAQITVAFSSRVSELAMPGGVIVKTGGATVPTRFTWGTGDRAVTLIPLALLQANTDYTVTVTGFEDLAGHTIPDRIWTFRTASVLDQKPPSIVRVEPAGTGVSPNATVAVAFSKPVAGDWIDGFRVTDLTLGVLAGETRFSDDQRTLFFIPSQPFPAGTISINIPQGIDDFAGNLLSTSPGSIGYNFRVAVSAPAAPIPTAATPDDGATDVPLNAQIQVQFDQSVASSSLDGVQLFENGSPSAFTVRVEADGRTVSVIPQRLPVPGSVYSLVAAGVKNSEGVAMASPYQSTFTMGSVVDTTSPVLRASPASGQSEVPLNAVLHVRSNKPLNKLTVNPRNISLVWTPFGNVPAGTQLQDSGRAILITPAAPLARDAVYNLTLNGITDLAGNQLALFLGPTFSVSFSTASGVATNPAVLLAVDPPDGSTVISGFQIQALFSQPVDLTLGDASFRVASASAAVPGSVSANGALISFTPTRILADGQYQIGLNGIADVAGTLLPAVNTTFTVDSGSATATRFGLMSSNPANSAVGVAVSSTVTLAFSKPVSAVSAAQLQVGSQGTTIPGSFKVEGSVVTFFPAVPLPGAAVITISGMVRDLQGFQAYVSLQFTTGANPDTNPPVLEFNYPTEGAVVPAFSTNIVLRFSKPVIAATGTIHVLAGSTDISGTFLAGEDGRTFTGSSQLPANSDITVASSTGIRDFAGNPLQPFAIHFRTLPDPNSRAPQIMSVSPVNGALNVPINQPVEIRFTQPVDSGTVQVSLHVIDAGSPVTGALTADAAGQIFDFQPNVPYGVGDMVAVELENSVYTLSGVRVDPAWYSSFRTMPPPGISAAPVAFSASMHAIDVRFDGPVPPTACHGYLHSGATRIPADCTASASDQIRITPAAPLTPGVPYRLVLDEAHEIVFQVDAPNAAEDAAIESMETDAAGTIALHFHQPVNPLTVPRGGIQLATRDGQRIAFTMQTSLDGTEVRIIPARITSELTVTIDGVESRTGVRLGVARIMPR